jgi:hypothetical protein
LVFGKNPVIGRTLPLLAPVGTFRVDRVGGDGLGCFGVNDREGAFVDERFGPDDERVFSVVAVVPALR